MTSQQKALNRGSFRKIPSSCSLPLNDSPSIDVRTASSFDDIKSWRPLGGPSAAMLLSFQRCALSIVAAAALAAALDRSVQEAPLRDRFNDHGLFEAWAGGSGSFGGRGGGAGGRWVAKEALWYVSFGGTGGCEYGGGGSYAGRVSVVCARAE